jgi:hypothetical protein
MSSTSSISLAVAGKLTGLHKVSILRAIRKDKISAEKDEHGEWRVQPAELFRLYRPLPEQRKAMVRSNNTQRRLTLRLKRKLRRSSN